MCKLNVRFSSKVKLLRNSVKNKKRKIISHAVIYNIYGVLAHHLKLMKGDLNKKQMKGASGRGRNFVVENRELIQEIQSILGEEIKEIRKLQEQTNNE
ncbi:30741_t:CDS:1, partial [Racocetra persica]